MADIAKAGGLLAFVATLFVTPAVLAAQTVAPKEGEFVLRDFRFASGEVLPELKLHYVTLGDPRGEPVLVLHGTGGSAESLLTPAFAGALFGPGQPLDTASHYIILPDSIGSGSSSKPSDGLRMKFPRYTYADMVEAQYRLVAEHLGVKRLKLVMGVSMGGMLTWMWGEAHPDFMEALIPLSSQPVQLAGRNWLYRRMVIDLIRADPAWNGGDYAEQPPNYALAQAYFALLSSGGEQAIYAAAPTWAAADRLASARVARGTGGDANDTIYQLEAARDYDPEPKLEAINARVLAINSADDERNPPALGVMGPTLARVRGGARLHLIPASPATRGHGTVADVSLWAGLLPDFLAGR
jgi:homoserine O-acetyltransferase